MAHLASFKSAGAVGVLRHDERTENDKVQSRKNECIDSKKTCLNYNLAPKRKGNLMEHIRQVCKDNNVRLSNRKDLNVMCSWIVTAPKTIPKDQISQFFLYCYSFLKKRYGEEYTLSATVHMDETTPHLHYSFIPVGYDKKNNRLTVSSKLVATRTELRSFQQELSKALENEFGYDVGILNEATKDGNKEIQELKLQTAQKRIAEAEQSAERAEKHLNELQGRVLNQEEVNALRGKKTLTGGLKGINYEEYLSLVKTAQSVDKAKTAVISAQNETKQVKQELSSVQMKHRTEVAKLKSELENERRLREKERRYYKQIVEKLSPEAFEAFKQAEIELRTENSRRSAQQHKRGLIR
ncbi:MAG: MobV family relaxase [Ruminococcus sp.]